MPSNKSKICFYANDRVYAWWSSQRQGDGGRLLNELVEAYILAPPVNGSVTAEIQALKATVRRLERLVQ
jgi:hypothetical protein